MKLIVARQELLAALIFASEDESRYILNGVCLQVNASGNPILVATDGRRLTVIESQAIQEEVLPTDAPEMVLRTCFVKPVCALSKVFGGKVFPYIAFERHPGGKRVVVTFMGGHVALDAEDGATCEGTFPNWRQCIPAKGLREPITDLGLNAEVVGDFARAAKLLECGNPVIQMNLVGKDRQVEVKIPQVPYFYGLVMQCKVDEAVDYQPEFLGIVEDLPKPLAETDEEEVEQKDAEVTEG